ncbi:CGNR zinc finger domain-containing protein [Kitasatospora sp. NPDC094019]|uniref:CGNR zinc finger domain-containing protein n=1 Tax=Kitasatospora sp. NPDC094019 TaxID=3364091 RepID=UPI003816A84B
MTGQVDFDSHNTAMVQGAADLVNLATPGLSRTRPYQPPPEAELTERTNAVLRAADRHATPLGTEDAARLAALAPGLRAVFEHLAADDQDRAVAATNTLMAQLRPFPVLERRSDEPWHLYHRSTAGDEGSDWAARLTLGLAAALGSHFAARLGMCSAPACDRAYVDVSRNGTRRFCSTACQSRVKSAAHRARAQDS